MPARAAGREPPPPVNRNGADNEDAHLVWRDASGGRDATSEGFAVKLVGPDLDLILERERGSLTDEDERLAGGVQGLHLEALLLDAEHRRRPEQ